MHLCNGDCSDGVRVRFRVRFQAVKVQIFGGFPVENPTKKANRLKALLRGISLSEYGSEGFRVRLRGLSEYGSAASLVERPTLETQGEQYSDTVLIVMTIRRCQWQQHSFVTLGKCLLVLFTQETSTAKGRRTAKAHKRCTQCEKN